MRKVKCVSLSPRGEEEEKDGCFFSSLSLSLSQTPPRAFVMPMGNGGGWGEKRMEEQRKRIAFVVAMGHCMSQCTSWPQSPVCPGFISIFSIFLFKGFLCSQSQKCLFCVCVQLLLGKKLSFFLFLACKTNFLVFLKELPAH